MRGRLHCRAGRRCTRRRRIDPFAPIWLDPSFSSSSFLACALISGRCGSRPLPSGLMGVKLNWRLLGQISLALTSGSRKTGRWSVRAARDRPNHPDGTAFLRRAAARQRPQLPSSLSTLFHTLGFGTTCGHAVDGCGYIPHRFALRQLYRYILPQALTGMGVDHKKGPLCGAAANWHGRCARAGNFSVAHPRHGDELHRQYPT